MPHLEIELTIQSNEADNEFGLHNFARWQSNRNFYCGQKFWLRILRLFQSLPEPPTLFFGIY